MNIFWIIISVILGGLGIAALVAVPCILWFGRMRSWKFRALWVGVAITPLLLFALFVSQVGSYEPDDPAELARGYEFELHRPPTDDVQGLRIRRDGVGDGVGSWVKFTASPRTVESLIKDFAPCESRKFDDAMRGANVPGWWAPGEDGMLYFYYTEGWEEGCGTFSFAYLAHDAGKNMVYFHHSGS